MFISKQNLSIVEILQKEKIEALDNLFFTRDGATVARNSKVLIITSPVVQEMREAVANVLNEKGIECAAPVPAETVKKVLKNIHADKEFKGLLEHADIEIRHGEVVFTTTNGKQEQTLKGKVYKRDYIDFLPPLQEAINNTISARVIVDINKLLSVLQILKKCSNGGSDNPVFIEFTKKNDIILRNINECTGQTTIALMTSYKGVEGKWLKWSLWEKRFFKIKDRVKRVFKPSLIKKLRKL